MQIFILQATDNYKHALCTVYNAVKPYTCIGIAVVISMVRQWRAKRTAKIFKLHHMTSFSVHVHNM